jgi:ATP-dependent DNA helicase RecG
MPIDVVKISEAQAQKILTYQEGHFYELKGLDARPGRLTATLAAFANADGGELFIGVDEEGVAKTRIWRGFADQEAANGHIQCFEGLFPLSTEFRYTFLSSDTMPGLLLKCDVHKTRGIRKSSEGMPYVRRGAMNLEVKTREALKQLEYVKGLASFETEPVDASVDIVANSVPVLEFMLAVIPAAEPGDWLKKQHLIRDGRPTVAGILLFAEEPQALLPKRCGVKVYRYRTRDKLGSSETLAFDPATVEGHLYAQIAGAVALTTRIIEETGRLGAEGVETVTYPPETLHEIITNAALHRDYSIADDIHIRIFDNRVEVQSPGRLPAHMTPDNILEERFARNGTLVRLVNKFPNPPNKDIGEGLNTAFAAMHKMGLKEPTVQNLDTAVLVTIRHETLASPEVVILEYLETHDTIRNKEAREICHIHGDYIVKELFRKLSDRQLIERVPGTRTGGTAYQKGPRFAEWRKHTDVGQK